MKGMRDFGGGDAGCDTQVATEGESKLQRL